MCIRDRCTIFHFGWGFAPYPAWGAYHAPPYHLAGFKGLLLRGDMGGWDERRKGKVEEGACSKVLGG